MYSENNIVFVQEEIEDKLGPMLLTAYLKSRGFNAEILVNPEKNLNKLNKMQPTFIGMCLLSPSADSILATCRLLKRELPASMTILGGPHPTFFPSVVEQDGVDVVCVGEGEKPLLQLLKQYDGTVESIQNISNLWVKKGTEIVKNSVSEFLSEQELSELPNCDRSHYYEHSSLRSNPHKKIWSSRGCPYNCSYCFNHAYKEIYRGQGRVFRQRSVDSVIEEIRYISQYGWKCLEIVDDQFLMDPEWVLEFCEKYEREFKLPFACHSSTRQIKPEIVPQLKKAGCSVVSFAIECGLEDTRTLVFNKPITNQEIHRAAELLYKNKLPFLTFNMVGLPDETIEDIYKTVELNQEIHTTYPWCSILQPYPGTQIAQYMKERGFIDDTRKINYSYFQSSICKDHVKQNMFFNAQKIFAHAVKTKMTLSSFKKFVLKPPFFLNRLYPFVFYWHYGKDIRTRYGLSWWALFRYWLYSRE